jgi:hypothetical protein
MTSATTDAKIGRVMKKSIEQVCFQAGQWFETNDLQKRTHFNMAPWSRHDA